MSDRQNLAVACRFLQLLALAAKEVPDSTQSVRMVLDPGESYILLQQKACHFHCDVSL